MNASMADYDNDGKLDIYVTNIRSEEAWYAEWPTVGRYMLNSWRQGVWVTDMPLYFQIFRQSGIQFHQSLPGDGVRQQPVSATRGDGNFRRHHGKEQRQSHRLVLGRQLCRLR